MIWTDKSGASIVVGCSSCAGSRELVNTAPEAESWARQHLERVHPPKAPEVRRAVAASQARARRATP